MQKIITLLVLAVFAFTSCTPSTEEPSDVDITGITLNKTTLSLKIDATFTLEATIEPKNATEKSVTWVSSDPTVATVSSEGEVKALAVGEATITATVGGCSATCGVTVSKLKVDVTNITLNKKTHNLRVNTLFVLEAVLEPYNATEETITWVSSNPTVATVSSDGKVKALAVGETIITVTVDGCSATCAVTVFQIDPPKVNDFYYSDGTWSTELNKDKQCIGVVFALNFDRSSIRNPAATLESPFPAYVNNPNKPEPRNLVVALENLGDVTNWDTATSFGKIVKTNAVDWYNGWNNTHNSEVLANLDKLPPFKRVNDFRTDELDWYLPSSYELLKLFLVFNGQSEQFRFDDNMTMDVIFAAYQKERDAFNARLVVAGGEKARISDSKPREITGYPDMPVFDDWDTEGAYLKWMTEVWNPWTAKNPGYQVELDAQAAENRLLTYWSSTSLDGYAPDKDYYECAIAFNCVTPNFKIFLYKHVPANTFLVRPILAFEY